MNKARWAKNLTVKSGGGTIAFRREVDGGFVEWGQVWGAAKENFDPFEPQCDENIRGIVVGVPGKDVAQAAAKLLAGEYGGGGDVRGCVRGCSRITGTVRVREVAGVEGQYYALPTGLKTLYRLQEHPEVKGTRVAVKEVEAAAIYFADRDFEEVAFKTRSGNQGLELQREKWLGEETSAAVDQETRRKAVAKQIVERWQASGKMDEVLEGALESASVVEVESESVLPVRVVGGQVARATGLYDLSSGKEVLLGSVLGMPAIGKRRVAVAEESSYGYGGPDWLEKIVYWRKEDGVPAGNERVDRAVFGLLQSAFVDDASAKGIAPKSRQVQVNWLDLNLRVLDERPYQEQVKPGKTMPGWFAMVADGVALDERGQELPEEQWKRMVCFVVTKLWISEVEFGRLGRKIQDKELRQAVAAQDAKMERLCRLLEEPGVGGQPRELGAWLDA